MADETFVAEKMEINLFFVSLNCNIPGANRLNPIKMQTSS